MRSLGRSRLRGATFRGYVIPVRTTPSRALEGTRPSRIDTSAASSNSTGATAEHRPARVQDSAFILLRGVWTKALRRPDLHSRSRLRPGRRNQPGDLEPLITVVARRDRSAQPGCQQLKESDPARCTAELLRSTSGTHHQLRALAGESVSLRRYSDARQSGSNPRRGHSTPQQVWHPMPPLPPAPLRTATSVSAAPSSSRRRSLGARRIGSDSHSSS